MIKLEALQQQFQAYLMGDNERLTKDEAHSINAHINSTTNFSRQQRLQVYANAYRLRLKEVLQTDYPALHALLGEQSFAEMTRTYIAAYPSSYSSLRWFGQHLPTFFQETALYSTQPYLTELASVEWAIMLTADSEDAPTLTVNDMLTIPPAAWESMRVQLHPAVRRLDLHWNVMMIREQLLQEQTKKTKQKQPKQQEKPKSLRPQYQSTAVPWVLWRQHFCVHYTLLTQQAARALDFIHQGCSFAEMCVHLAEDMSEEKAGYYAASMLKNWLNDGLISKIIL